LNMRHVALAALTLLAGCAGNQTIAPIEDRITKPEVPVVRAPPPVAPKPAAVPVPGQPIVKPLPDVESPAVRAVPIPESGAGTPLPSTLAPPTGAAPAPAIAGLIAKADQSSAQGQYDAARANLERAVKIAPRDAELWQRLAMVSYAQEDWSQAKALAERSNSFAAQNSPLAARNWTLIGNAELKLGNQSAAAAAFERAGAAPP
jgi:uncharacterized protein HemY